MLHYGIQGSLEDELNCERHDQQVDACHFEYVNWRALRTREQGWVLKGDEIFF